jgi:hypothetical protein
MNTSCSFVFRRLILSAASTYMLFFFLIYSASAQQSASSPSGSPSPTPTSTSTDQTAQTSSDQPLDTVTVIGQLNEARYQIVPDLGATKYSIGQTRIQSMSQGDNASFNQVILRAPGVAQDSYGQLHVRDEHANHQYRFDDVLIPEGISGFGQEIDTRLVQNVDLITDRYRLSSVLYHWDHRYPDQGRPGLKRCRGVDIRRFS